MFTGRTITCDATSPMGGRTPFVAYIHECDECKKNFMVNKSKQTRAMNGNSWRPAFKHSFCSRECRYGWAANHARGGSIKAVYRTSKTGKQVGIVRIYVPKKDRAKHGLCDNRGYMPEHRYKIENLIGRTLLKEETVHHKNGNPFDNDIGNLELRSGNHGCGATSYTEEVNRLLGMIPKPVEAEVFSLAEYAER